MVELKITSPAFDDANMIPVKFTVDGENINPEINIEGVPDEAKSLVLIVDDPDAPNGVWTHWVVFGISADKIKIGEGSVPGIEGMNDFRNTSYGGPAPPVGEHRYFFKVYALDIELGLGEGAFRHDVEKQMEGHVVAEGSLRGRYRRD